jgi:hypothetical protein
MRKIDAIEKVMLDNGGTASWSVIYDNITKYYPNAKSSDDWKEGLRGVLYREMNSNNRFKKIGLGIFALGNYQEDRKPEDKETVRMHSYIEGICVELGNFNNYLTYTADPSALYRDKLHLSDVATLQTLPEFSYEQIVKRAKLIDVVWINSRGLQFPQKVFEIVDSISTLNGAFNRSLQLKNFMTEFNIVAPEKHREKFLETIDMEVYQEQKARFKFINYDDIQEWYDSELRNDRIKSKLFGHEGNYT